MRTDEQNNQIIEYMEVSQMHLLDGFRLLKLDAVKKGVEGGSPRYGEFMAMVGLDPNLGLEPSKELVKNEIKIAVERRRVYFEEIKGLFESITKSNLDRDTKKRLDSHYVELVKNHESDNEIKI